MAILEFVVGPARVAFTDRHGGVSPPPYDTANLGFATGDDPDAVAENRRRIATELGGAAAAAGRWVWVHQVHGSRAVRVSRPSDAGVPADALVTATDGLPLMVLTADCVPVALVTDAAVGAVHAGWRGLLSGVVESAVAELRSGSTGRVRAMLGPCIHAQHYEFGVRELEQLAARLGPEVRAATSSGAPALDLSAGVRAALARAGVEDVDDVDVCTFASSDYFSHRRDGATGRQALVIVRQP